MSFTVLVYTPFQIRTMSPKHTMSYIIFACTLLKHMSCSKTALTGETWFHCEFKHPQDANGWPPRREANRWPTGPLRLCIGVKLQGLHRASPSKFTRALTVHCVARRRRTCKEWNRIREGMCDHSWLFTSSSQSLVQLSIVGVRHEALGEAIDQSCLGHQCR